MPAAFVPGFDHDVFVSYAHVDNQPLLVPGGVPTGWVDTLVENLKRLLSQQLGRKDWGKLWFDPNLRGDEPFPPVLREAVSRSATLLVILSEGYLQSDWCRSEREAFFQAAAQQGNAQGRIFVVQLMGIERSRWPQEFGDLLGYEFFSKEREHAPVRTLRMLADDPGNQLYFRRLDDLSRELAERLRRLREQPAISIQQPAAATAEIKVFLAEVTPDLEEWRDNLRSQLKQDSIQALPTTYYDRSPPAFKAAMEKDLAASTLFVQLLGPYTTPKTHDLPRGYEGLQLELARAAGKTILRWHDPGLDRKTVRDPELLACEPVMVMPFEDFKRAVKDQAQLLASQRNLTLAAGEAFALINAKSPDMAVAQAICKVLEDHAIGYEIIDETENLINLAQTCDYHALIVIYGQCEQAWVQKQVRDCRTVMLGKKGHNPHFGHSNQQISDGGMRDQQRLKRKIDDLQRQWELLDEKLSKLNGQWIVETRVEEQLRLKNLIDDTQTQRNQIEEQLKDMESQLAKVASDTMEVAGRNDDRGWKKASVPVCAVCIGPPPEKEPLRIKPPRFHFFSDPHEPAFHQFIQAIQAQVAG